VASQLTFTWREIPTATLGSPSATSMLHAPHEFDVDTRDVADAAMADGLARGRPRTTLPFTSQSGYDRVLTPTRHPVAVLEGQRLRATFLLDLGGRLWSLVDVSTGRELLYTNPVIQFANLAIRDAWFAGGVEWNVGLIGHTPLTCSPMHAASVEADGGVVLRLWEFDRLRDCVYRLDAWLDETTGLLCVRPEIFNPNPVPVDTYWWSNAAVPMTADTRVLVPADSAWVFGFDKVMRKVPVGQPGDDSPWPARATNSADYFYDLQGARRPWIAAVEPDGCGFVQTSTACLQGRKLFVWGRGQGGRRWQQWLSPLGGEYAEIQAGLARTQMEHVQLDAGSRVHWIETYGPLSIEPEAATGDWSDARAGVERAIQDAQPDAWLAGVEKAAEQVAGLPPSSIEYRGSGWGALERARREAGGDSSLSLHQTPFDDNLLGPEQQPWLSLLRQGAFPPSDPLAAPGSYQRSTCWVPLLKADAGWRAQLHLGEIYWQAGDDLAARAAWQASIDAVPNPWAWRDLGVAAIACGDAEAAAQAYGKAFQLRPDELGVVLEYLAVLPAEVELGVIDALPDAMRRDPRVRIAAARAALAAGLVERALDEFSPLPELPTLREGDAVLSDTWRSVQDALAGAADTPLVRQWRARGSQLPLEWDFSMAPNQTKESA